jgi:hypothetical protein
MTKKDYQLIADAISKEVKLIAKEKEGIDITDGHYHQMLDYQTLSCKRIVKTLVNNLPLTNPNFDRTQFIVACGLPADVLDY